jgi:hypothetical protein
VKFLLWQFAAYAGAAMAIGFALGIAWATSTRRALTRHLERVERTLESTETQLRRVREQRSRDDVAIRESRELSSKLVELHASLALVEADVRANQIGRVEAERMRDEAVLAADRYRAEAAVARQTEFELARAREKLAAAHAALEAERAATMRAVSDAEARAARLTGELAALRRAHDERVVAHQRELSAALVDAEQAYAQCVTLEAQLTRSERVRTAALGPTTERPWTGVATPAAAAALAVERPSADDEIIDLRSVLRSMPFDAATAATAATAAAATAAPMAPTTTSESTPDAEPSHSLEPAPSLEAAP